mgnify:CR=1 FL=1
MLNFCSIFLFNVTVNKGKSQLYDKIQTFKEAYSFLGKDFNPEMIIDVYYVLIGTVENIKHLEEHMKF